MTLVERLWLGYCAAVLAAALLGADGAVEGYRLGPFVLLHALAAGLQAAPAALERRRQPAVARAVRCALAIVLLPVVFSALCWILPGAHPEPYQLAFLRLDAALFGGEATVRLRDALPSGLRSALQLSYAAFYLLPIGAALAVGRRRGLLAFDRCVALLVGGFLFSYLGYLLVPTLGPKDVMPMAPAAGSAWADALHAALNDAEANPWNCFPSGHTMMSLVSMALVRRWAASALWWAAPLAVSIVLSTMALRYHWPVDVVGGALLAWAWLRLGDRLLAQDDAPAA